MIGRWKEGAFYVAITVGSCAVLALLFYGMARGFSAEERRMQERRLAQQRAYEVANRACDNNGRPASIVPHGGLTWWLEVRCSDGTVRAIPMQEGPA